MDCPWNKWLLHGLNYSHPGTKAYIVSLAELYSTDWELDMLKIDCVFGGVSHQPVRMVRVHYPRPHELLVASRITSEENASSRR